MPDATDCDRGAVVKKPLLIGRDIKRFGLGGAVAFVLAAMLATQAGDNALTSTFFIAAALAMGVFLVGHIAEHRFDDEIKKNDS
jgi:hypothetical protein